MDIMYKKVLLISRSAWRNDRNSGGTYTSIFKNWPSDSVSHLYTSPESPLNNICTNYYCITDNDMLKSIFSTSAGKIIHIQNGLKNTQKLNGVLRIRNFCKIMPRTLLQISREFLWKLGKINYEALDRWVENQNPDYVHLSGTDSIFLYKLALHIIEKYQLPYVMYISDDIYSYNSYSPLYLIRQSCLRKNIRYFIARAKEVFVISEKQKNEYENQFNRKMTVITKDFLKHITYIPKIFDSNIQNLVYIGNLYNNRWKNLAKLAKAIQHINQEKVVCCLSIYSNFIVSNKIKNKLVLKNASNLFATVPQEDVRELLLKADILVHTESFRNSGAKLSFSAKLVEYFMAGRCILAIGPDNIASFEYLLKNDAAYIISSKRINEIENRLKKLLGNPKLINEYGRKAYSCGTDNHGYGSLEQRYLTGINSF